MLLPYFKTGGFLMIPIALDTFMIWFDYFLLLAKLKGGAPQETVRHDLQYLAALVAVAPLLGLLGTVLGMIDTFHATATLSVPNPAALAGGIGKALITTQAGLAAAIPGSLALAHIHHLNKTNHA